VGLGVIGAGRLTVRSSVGVGVAVTRLGVRTQMSLAAMVFILYAAFPGASR
jgi:hypothetical protein